MLRRAAVIALALAFAAPAFAQTEARTERVEFAKGASSKAIKGSVKGYASTNYVVGLRAGQTLSVDLKTRNLSNYFNVMGPGADTAAFVGSTSGGSYKAVVPKAGDYTVQVYLMRNAARRGEVANYTLTIGAK